MYVSYRFEISTQPEYFARWFNSTVAQCMPMHMEIDSKRGVAKFHGPDELSVTGNKYQWLMTSHEYYDDRFASRPKYDTKRLHLELLHMMPPEIGYRAKSPAPGRLQVVLWCQGEELIADLRSVVSEIEEAYGLILRTIDDEIDAAAIAADSSDQDDATAVGRVRPAEAQPVDKRGIKVGTAARVIEAHRLMKTGLSQRQACSTARTDPRTYQRLCLQVTGEEPELPYR